MLNYKKFLVEDRTQFVKDWWDKEFVKTLSKHKPVTYDSNYEFIKTTIYDFAIKTDPTQKKIYVQWMLKYFLNQMVGRLDNPAVQSVVRQITREDSEQWKQTLEDYEKLKPRLPQNMRDINSLTNGINALRVLLEPYQDVKSKRELKRDEIAKFKQDIITCYTGPEGSIYIPKTWEASQYLGRGTTWCTAMRNESNWFEKYSQEGPLFDFLYPDGTKWQLHLESKQFMNENDHPISLFMTRKDALLRIFINHVMLHDQSVEAMEYVALLYGDRIEWIEKKLPPEGYFQYMKNINQKIEWMADKLPFWSAYRYSEYFHVRSKVVETKWMGEVGASDMLRYIDDFKYEGARLNIDDIINEWGARYAFYIAEYLHMIKETNAKAENAMVHWMKTNILQRDISFFNYMLDTRKERWIDAEPYIAQFNRDGLLGQYLKKFHITEADLKKSWK